MQVFNFADFNNANSSFVCSTREFAHFTES